MEQFILERIEDGVAVLEKEDGSHISIPSSLIGEAGEGSVLVFDGESYRVDEAEAARRREKMKNRHRRIFGA